MFRELNIYTEALEKRLSYLEDIFKAAKINPKQVEDNLKAEYENILKVAKLEKRLNSIDKKVKNVESLIPEKKGNPQTKDKKCVKCNKEFSDFNSLNDHMKEKHATDIKCRFCDETFKQTWMLEMHLNSHVEKSLKCEQCEQSFHLKWRLKKHMEIHTDVNVKFCHFFNNCEECPYIDPGCMFKHESSPYCKFQKSCNRKLCQFRHRKSEEDKLQSLKSPHCKKDSPKASSNLTCPKCNKRFILNEQLELHLTSDHSKKTYPCEKCYFVFHSEEKFRMHLTGIQHNLAAEDDYQDDDEEYKDDCRLCKSVFTTYANFDDHQDSYLRCNQ